MTKMAGDAGEVEAGGLQLEAVSATFGKHVVLENVSLAVRPGETLVLFGPSGAGKTVLLRTIAGVEGNAVGRVLVGDRDVSAEGPERRGLGVAFQNFALYPHMTARENIASPLQARRLSSAQVSEKVDQIARLLKIDHVLGHQPRQLSNGQKQRTALARALVGEPGVLLLDDPLRNVDAKLRYEMRFELPRLLRRYGAATIYVSQDYREAMALADRVAVLIDGRIVQEDVPEAIYDAPATTAVARLFGDPPVNLVACRPEAVQGGLRVHAAGLELMMPQVPAASGREMLLGLRPETIMVSTSGAGASAELVAVTPLHERFVLLLRLPDGQELLASTAGETPPPGPVRITADASRALLYDAADGRRIAGGVSEGFA